MKKFIIVLALIMMLSFAACDSKGKSDGDDDGDSGEKSGVSSEITDAINDYTESEYGFKSGDFKVEFEVSAEGAKMLIISGRLEGEIADDEEYEDYEDYKDGYLLANVITYNGETVVAYDELWEKTDEADFNEELKEMEEQFDGEKESMKEELADVVKMLEEEDMALSDIF